ncbi:MAG: protein phosphatase CheZ [Alphaproteobacteria bacterium]|nr:protein phosphatase CheZ [Alphaproteobacteria bacterium]
MSKTSEIKALEEKLETMDTFIKRRFDELSMEVNATAQQVDMAESGIAKKFTEILEVISAISYHGDGQSAANSGVQLEAVIEDTENAANTILDAADRISTYLDDDSKWSNSDNQANMKQQIRKDIQEILMACTFQDLTGQRIRNTLNNLHDIESRISSTFEKLGIDVKPDEHAVEEKVQRASSQEEIDALLKGFEAGESMCVIPNKTGTKGTEH